MDGKTIIIGDFAELDESLRSGAISQSEYQKTFEQSRFHGLKGDIFPFAVGGSDAAAIIGVSPWKTPLLLYHEKTGMIKQKNEPNKEILFLAGHLFEGPFREMFASVSGLRTESCSMQAGNTAYPHLVANIDGIVWENGIPGIYEGKTTRPYTQTWSHFKNNEVPVYYMAQLQFYMEIWNLDFAYINCCCGLDVKNDMRYIRVNRNSTMGKDICNACEQFVLNAMVGIRPSNAIVQSQSVLAKDAEILYGDVDTSLPPVSLPNIYEASFRRLDTLEKEYEDVLASMAPFEEKITAIEKEMTDDKKRLKAIEKEKLEILKIFPDQIKNATSGVLTIGNESWIVHYDKSGKFSLDAEVKQYWRENFPECYEKVSQYKPVYSRRLSYEKREK